MNLTNLIFRHILILLSLSSLGACTETAGNIKSVSDSLTKITPKMKVEIWSDVMCPFCYIGKRKFELALEKFSDKNQIEIVWKSFQLNPELRTDPSKSTIKHLSETKGWSIDYTKNTIAYVTDMAKEVGLNYDFDRVVVANSFDAHRLIQLAKKHGKGNEMEEKLFKAYFCEGKNTADHAILIQLAIEAGLNAAEVDSVLSTNSYTKEVLSDLQEAENLRIQGVPFFVFNRKYAVSGAQDSKVFLDTLTKAWKEFAKN